MSSLSTWLFGAAAPPTFFQDAALGAGVTLFATCVAFVIGLMLSVGLMLMRISPSAPIRSAAMIYISAIRGTPALIQMLIAYYVVPTVLDINLSPLAAGVLALALNTTAYCAEILRGALHAVPRGQTGAAKALGMRAPQVWMHVILPQMFYRVIPPLTNEFTVLLKASSLLSIIAVSELSEVARNASLQSDRPLEVFAVTAVIYFLILFTASSLSRRLERRFERVMNHGH